MKKKMTIKATAKRPNPEKNTMKGGKTAPFKKEVNTKKKKK